MLPLQWSEPAEGKVTAVTGWCSRLRLREDTGGHGSYVTLREVTVDISRLYGSCVRIQDKATRPGTKSDTLCNKYGVSVT